MAFEELKQRQSVMWGNGPYQRITETIVDIHDIVLERLAPQDGDRFLDLACGTGAVAERASAAGADVTGIDLAPALIETARERAGSLGLAIDYEIGDAENLDVPDASFDKLASTCGIMFAPDHDAFGYLGDRYGLEVIPITGISPEVEPSPQDLAHISDLVSERGVTTVFVEPLLSPEIGETVAREAGAETAVLNPLEGLTEDELERGENYFTVMRANLDALREGLGCR